MAKPRSASRSKRPVAASPGKRLHKVLADAGVAARRACETMIESGRVTVNGRRVTKPPVWIDPDTDQVEVDGQPVILTAQPRPGAARAPRGSVYFMLHKPKRVISTAHDPEGRATVLDLIPAELRARKRLYPVGRLDAQSTGLILLTNDGELAHRLTHPSYEIPKQYELSIRGHLTLADLDTLKRGLYLADHGVRSPRKDAAAAKRARMAKVQLLEHERDRSRGDRTRLRVTLHEGQNREIRRMVARLGHKVLRLHRTAIGPLKLTGLAVSQWRALTATERCQLQRSVGLDQSDPRPSKRLSAQGS